jgi:hypothetical protein
MADTRAGKQEARQGMNEARQGQQQQQPQGGAAGAKEGAQALFLSWCGRKPERFGITSGFFCCTSGLFCLNIHLDGCPAAFPEAAGID